MNIDEWNKNCELDPDYASKKMREIGRAHAIDFIVCMAFTLIVIGFCVWVWIG